MTSRRLADVESAYSRWVETWADTFGPHRGPCLLCGCPDARHRVADAMVSLYQAGEPLTLIAYNFDVPGLPELGELVAAGLAYEVARRRARLPRDWQPGP